MVPDSSSLSGAAPKEAPSAPSPRLVIPRLFARFSSRFCFLISTCCSSRRRRSSSGLKVFFALNVVLRCSGMYRSAMVRYVVLLAPLRSKGCDEERVRKKWGCKAAKCLCEVSDLFDYCERRQVCVWALRGATLQRPTDYPGLGARPV